MEPLCEDCFDCYGSPEEIDANPNRCGGECQCRGCKPKRGDQTEFQVSKGTPQGTPGEKRIKREISTEVVKAFKASTDNNTEI